MENKWIKCSEQIPELCEFSKEFGNNFTISVLCTDGEGEMWVAYFDCDGSFWDPTPFAVNSKARGLFTPTYWTYLPKDVENENI